MALRYTVAPVICEHITLGTRASAIVDRVVAGMTLVATLAFFAASAEVCA